LAAGSAASAGAGAVADKYKLAPEAKDLLVTSAFFFPAMAGAAAAKASGFQGGFGTDAEGNPAAVAGAFGGKVKAGAVATPEAYEARAQVGDTKFGVRIPRQPDPMQATAQDILGQNTQTMQDAARTEAAAKMIVAGASPEQAVAAQQPKAPPSPQQQAAAEIFPNPVIAPERINQAVSIVRTLPPEERGPALLEAHKSLSEQIAQWHTFIGPDGKTYTVNSPKDAEKFASQFINEEVDRHEAAIQQVSDDATKQAQEAAKASEQTPAAETTGTSKLQQAAQEKQLQRVKTLLESNEWSPERPPVSLIQRNLGVGYGRAVDLFNQYRASQVPTVGSKEEPVVEESKATIDAQMEALKRGDIRVVHIPAGGKYLPEQPSGIQKVQTRSSDPGAGTYFFRPGKGLRKQTILEASKAGTHGDLLGHIQTKEDLANAPGTVAVVARDAKGTEIQASEVDASKPELAQQQAQILQERHPQAQVSVEPTDKVIEDRLAAQGKGDIFDEVATNSQSDTKGGRGESASGGTEQGAAGTPAATPPEERIEGHDGKKTTVLTPTGKHEGMYRVVEADSLVPSHDAHSFAPNPKYPAGVQERDYEKPESKHRVITQAQNFNPDYIINSNPDAVNGPPIVTPDGIVLGGNSRTMTVQRAYRDKDLAQEFKRRLKASASDFGVDAAKIDGMKQPVLVREIAKPGTREEMERLGSALNKTQMGALSPVEKAVSAGRKITPEAMDELARLIDAAGEDASIRDMLRESGMDALKILVDTGSLTDREAQGFMDGKALSEAGKDFIENALLGAIVADPKLMDPEKGAPRAILNKLDGALAAVIHLSGKHDDYDLIGVLRDALEQHAEVRRRKTNIEAFQKQTGVFDQRDANPVVDALARFLTEKPTAVKKALRGFAADAKDARLGQGDIFGGAAEPYAAFNEWFGSKISEKEYADGLARGVSEDEPRAAASRQSAGDGGVQEGGAGKPEAEGQGGADKEPAEPERKYKYGNTQHNLDPNSSARQTSRAMAWTSTKTTSPSATASRTRTPRVSRPSCAPRHRSARSSAPRPASPRPRTAMAPRC
jgi:hypothetical protein